MLEDSFFEIHETSHSFKLLKIKAILENKNVRVTSVIISLVLHITTAFHEQS